MPSSFATRALALVSFFSLAAATPKPQWKRQASANTTAPFDLGTGTATTTVSTTVTATPVGASPTASVVALTCSNDLIAAGFSAEPAEATSFCSSFLGYPHITVTTDGITETLTSTTITTHTITTATVTTTTPCSTSISTVTTILTTALPARRDVMPLTARAALPSDHPFVKLERQASDELAMSDCSTLLSTFSNDCSCLFIPTSTTTVCGTETVTRTASLTVNVLTSATAATCSGSTVITSTETLYILTHPTTTMTSTVPPTSIPTTGSNSTSPAVTSSPTSLPVTTTPAPVSNSSVPLTTTITPTETSIITSSNGAYSQNSTSYSVPPFPTTSMESRVATITVTLPATTVTDVFPVGPNGTTVTIPGQTVTIPPITTTILVTETITPIPVNTTSAPYTYANGTTTTPFMPTGTGASTGIIPPVNTTSAPYTYPNGTAPTTAPTAPTAPSSGFPTTTANYTVPPFTIGNETRTGGYPTGTGTGTAPVSGTGPLTSVPYFVPNVTRTFSGTVTTTYTTLVTITTEYPSVYVSVETFGSASTTTYVGSTIYPEGTGGSIFYSEPVPTTYTYVPRALAATSAPAKRWGGVRREAPREILI